MYVVYCRLVLDCCCVVVQIHWVCGQTKREQILLPVWSCTEKISIWFSRTRFTAAICYNCKLLIFINHCSSRYSIWLGVCVCVCLSVQTVPQQQQSFYGPLSGTTPGEPVPTHHSDHHSVFISFFHLLRSIVSSLFKLCAWQSFFTTSVHVLFGLPLGLEPSTSYSIYFFAQLETVSIAEQLQNQQHAQNP